VSLALAFDQSLLEAAGLGPEGLVGSGHGNNDQEREDQAKGSVDSPGLKDDTQVLGLPVEQHVHTAGWISTMVSAPVVPSSSTSTSVSAVSSSVVHVCVKVELG
jgi:hypothetical protein